MWADNSGFYGNGTAYIRLWVNDSKSVYLNCYANGVSDLELGVVDALYLAEMRALTWKWNTGNVCGVRMYYGVNATRNGTEGSNYYIEHNETDYGDWTGTSGDDDHKTIQQYRAWPSGLNLLDGLTPGQDYYLDFCLKIKGSVSNNWACDEDQVALDNNGGNYHVHFRVADSKSTFTAGSYLYFDARTLTSWQTANPDIEFYFKEYYYGNDDIGDPQKCLKTNALENWVYYVQVPSGSRNGTVELDRVKPAGSSDPNYYWNKTNYMYACDRANASQNCLVGDGSDKWSSWSPTWSTYCPPMSASTLSDDGTTLSWGGSGTSESPYLIPTSSTIKVSASSTSALTDANMTDYYLFKKAGTAQGSGSSTKTKNIAASSSTGTKEAITVEAYNYYNSTEGTHLTSNSIYYEVRTPYNIAYNKGSNGKGDNVTDVKLKDVNITLRGATFTRTGYTQTAWNTNSAGTGGTNYNLSASYTGNAALTLYPTWTAKTYTLTLNPNTANRGTGSNVSVTATYDNVLPDFTKAVPASGYTLDGYYTAANSGIKIINADGSLVRNIDGYTSNDATPTWQRDKGDLTLYAHYVGYPSGYIYITDVKSTPESGPTASKSSLNYNSGIGINDNFDYGSFTGRDYGCNTGASGYYLLTFDPALDLTGYENVKLDLWWGNNTTSTRGYQIYLNDDASALTSGSASDASDRKKVLTVSDITVSATSISKIKLTGNGGGGSSVFFRVGIKGDAASCSAVPTVSTTTLGTTTTTTQVVNCAGISSLGTGTCTISDYGFVYGTSEDPTVSDNKVQVGTTYTTTNVAFDATTIESLTPGATYYVRAYATNGYGTAYGTGTSFTTHYAITTGSHTNGSVTIPSSAAPSASVAISATPSTGYSFSSWTIKKTSDGSDVTASVSLSGTTSATFTMPDYAVTVDATFSCTTPTIGTNPSDATVCKDATKPALTVAASANGGTLSYQWYSNTTQSTSDATLLTDSTKAKMYAPTGTAGTKYYYCVVTNTTGGCSATSDIATVTVKGAATITWGTQPSNGTVGDDDFAYAVSCSDGSSVTVTSNNTDVATIVGGKLHYVAAGTTYLIATATDACGNEIVQNSSNFTVSAYSGSSSINLEQGVLDHGKSWGYASALTSADIAYSLGGSTELDSLNDAADKSGNYKLFRNYPYLGLKIKNSGSYVSVNLPKDKALNVKFGYIKDSVKVFIDDTEIKPSPIKSNTSKESKTYALSSSGSNRTVKFQTPNGNAVVIKQIMVGESLESITLPAKITLGATTNGSISVDNTIVDVGSDVAITVTPSSGYELDELTVTRDTIDNPEVSVTNNEFTMPNNNVTINATFVLSCSAPTSPSISGTTSYTVGDNISLTASATGTSGSSTYTWYKGATWDAASATSSIGSSATFSKASCVVADAGTYWCNISNGTGCDVQVSQAITVAKADISPVLTYDPTTLIRSVASPTPTLTGNTGGGSVSYSITASSPASAATINTSTGVVSPTKVGTITVTATIGETTNYNGNTATFDLEIRAPYTVYFRAGDGTVTPTYAIEESYDGVDLPTPTYASHTFLGWYNGVTNVGKTGKFIPTEDGIYLYAGWKETCAGGGADPGTTEIIGFTTATCSQNAGSGGERTLSNVTNLTVAHELHNGGSDSLAVFTTASQGMYFGTSTATYSRGGYKWNKGLSSLGRSNNTVGFSVTVGSGYQFTIDSISFGMATSSDNFHYQIIVYQSGDTLYKTAETAISNYKTDKSTNHEFHVNGLSAQSKLQNLTGTFYVRVRMCQNSTGKYFYLPMFQVIGNLHATGGGGSSCYYVTYDGNGATSGYTSDPTAYSAGDPVNAAYHSDYFGFKRTGYDFVEWNTAADGSGTAYKPSTRITNSISSNITLYAQWGIVISSDNTNFAGKDTPSQYRDVRVTNGATLTLTQDTTVRDITVESGATLYVSTNSGSKITLKTNSLTLVGGWTEINGQDKYDMPRVYIDPKSKITRTNKTINFKIAVDNRNFYPIAVPFKVAMKDVVYDDVTLDAIATYGTQYSVKTYNGYNRANGTSPTWRQLSKYYPQDTLRPGHGYILSAVPALGWGQDTAVIRFPMKDVADEWLAAGELGRYSTYIKDTVHVTAYRKDGDTDGSKTAKANTGWNLLGVPYMSCYQTGADMYDGDNVASPATLIQGKINFDNGQWKDTTVRYVTIPTHDFTEYIQVNIEDEATVLKPGWCFFIQASETGNLRFLSDSIVESSTLPYRVKNEQVPMPTYKTGIILTDGTAKDKASFLISDQYSAAEYEINADLEKMFGENGYTLATYSLSGSTRLAYNAMSNADAANIIPIGYRAPADGEYTFSINPRYAENGAFESVNLIDYETGIVTDLMSYSYTFSTERTQNDARFALNVTKRQDTTTDIENGATDANGVRKVLINKELYIILDGKMYDATGKAVK